MRLIDVDALISKLANKEYANLRAYFITFGNLYNLIDNMPTALPFGRWISVEDKLPKTSGKYLVFTGLFVEFCHWVLISEEWLDEQGFPDTVKYWMPLPNMPKEK
jgi:hypothetical protein